MRISKYDLECSNLKTPLRDRMQGKLYGPINCKLYMGDYIHKMGSFVVAMSDINQMEYLDRMIQWRQRVSRWK